MNITQKTVLITGGGSGIGFEIAKQLIEKNNNVIIIGRTEAKLQKAAEKLGNVKFFASDITKPGDSAELRHYLENSGGLDILINNAAHGNAYTLLSTTDTAAKATEEFNTNVFSVMRLIDELLPLLRQSPEAAIVNVTSAVAFAPAGGIPTYSASKAALHSYTESLRFVLSKDTTIKVFELMPPLVDTEFSSAIGGANGIPPKAVADSLLSGFESDTYEIHTGDTAYIHNLVRSGNYNDAFNALNQ